MFHKENDGENIQENGSYYFAAPEIEYAQILL